MLYLASLNLTPGGQIHLLVIDLIFSPFLSAGPCCNAFLFPRHIIFDCCVYLSEAECHTFRHILEIHRPLLCFPS